jgi:hypothetical protein
MYQLAALPIANVSIYIKCGNVSFARDAQKRAGLQYRANAENGSEMSIQSHRYATPLY